MLGQTDQLYDTALAVQLKLVGLNPRDALAAQMGLESAGAELAATNATQADLRELECLLGQAAAVVDDQGPAFTDASSAFHDAIARAAHNWAIETGLRAIRELLRQMLVQDIQPARARRVLRTHREIHAAIRAGDADLAAHLMRAHVRAMRDASQSAGSHRLKGASTRRRPVSTASRSLHTHNAPWGLSHPGLTSWAGEADRSATLASERQGERGTWET